MEREERPLHTARCEHGCSLAVTSHGLWEWRRGAAPTRDCWRTIDSVTWRAGHLTVHGGTGPPRCAHRLDAADDLPLLAVTLEKGSRLVDISVRLASGRRARIQARSCVFEGTVVWTSTLDPFVATDGGRDDLDETADRAVVAFYLDAARREYGTVAGHWW